jgi:hypothetical protein
MKRHLPFSGLAFCGKDGPDQYPPENRLPLPPGSGPAFPPGI